MRWFFKNPQFCNSRDLRSCPVSSPRVYHQEQWARPAQPTWRGGDGPTGGGEASTQEATPLGDSDSDPHLFTFHSATLELFSLIIVITTIERGQFGGIFSGKANSHLPLVLHHIPALVTFEVNYLSSSRLRSKIICWNSFPGFPVSENCAHISPTFFQRNEYTY